MRSESVTVCTRTAPPVARIEAVQRPGFAAAAGDGQVHGANRLFGGAAVRPGDTADRDGNIGVLARDAQQALRHLCHGLGGDCAMGFKRCGAHAQHFMLGRIGIGDKAAADTVGRARNLGQCARNQAARAAFGAGGPQARLAQRR